MSYKCRKCNKEGTLGNDFINQGWNFTCKSCGSAEIENNVVYKDLPELIRLVDMAIAFVRRQIDDKTTTLIALQNERNRLRRIWFIN